MLLGVNNLFPCTPHSPMEVGTLVGCVGMIGTRESGIGEMASGALMIIKNCSPICKNRSFRVVSESDIGRADRVAWEGVHARCL